MRFWILAVLMLFPISGYGYQIEAIQVAGEGKAVIEFVFDKPTRGIPKLKTKDDQVTLTFIDATLSKSLADSNKTAPHALIESLRLRKKGPKIVQAEFKLNGHVSDLKERLSLTRTKKGVQLQVAAPLVGVSPELRLLQREQQPIAASVTPTGSAPELSETHWARVVVFALFVALAAAGGIFGMRYLKRQGKWKGSRKYLIEQLSYCPLGQKMGVSLLKIGSEFILVGVTPNQIRFLSKMDEMSKTYGDEAKLERDHFQEVVKNELSEIKKPALHV